MWRINYDALGIAATAACAIHCALLPLMLTSLPILGVNIIEHRGFEYLMILLAAGIGYYSVGHGFLRHHRRALPLIIFSSGLVLLVVKQFYHEYQLVLLIPAVALIIIGHLLNYRSCRTATSCVGGKCNH